MLVPGLEPPRYWGGIGDSDEQEMSVDGIGHVITWSELPSEHGGFTVEIDGEEAQLTCEYDDSSWVGGRDGLYLEPPFHVVTETPASSELGEWAFTAWIISRLLEHGNDDQEWG